MKAACAVIIVIAMIFAAFFVVGVYVNRGTPSEKAVTIIAGALVVLIVWGVLHYICNS